MLLTFGMINNITGLLIAWTNNPRSRKVFHTCDRTFMFPTSLAPQRRDERFVVSIDITLSHESVLYWSSYWDFHFSEVATVTCLFVFFELVVGPLCPHFPLDILPLCSSFQGPELNVQVQPYHACTWRLVGMYIHVFIAHTERAHARTMLASVRVCRMAGHYGRKDGWTGGHRGTSLGFWPMADRYNTLCTCTCSSWSIFVWGPYDTCAPVYNKFGLCFGLLTLMTIWWLWILGLSA